MLWSRFDYIGVVCYTGYKERYELLAKELERVGIEDYHVHWDFPSPYKTVLAQNVPMTRFNAKRGCFFIGLNHYQVFSTAYHLGCKTCLILEDDIRFLLDVSKIKESIEQLPEDFNLAMFDFNKPCKLTEQEFVELRCHKVNLYWAKFNMLGSSGCYALDRRGMARMMELHEAPLSGTGLLFNIDHYFRESYLPSMNLYVSIPGLAIQHSFNIRHYAGMPSYYALRGKIGDSRAYYAI